MISWDELELILVIFAAGYLAGLGVGVLMLWYDIWRHRSDKTH